MNRILFEPGEIRDNGHVRFGGARAEHVMSVLHGETGQRLKTGVVDGPIGTSEIVDCGREGDGWFVEAKCTHCDASAVPWIDLILAPPRPRAMKRLLPQLAALGVGKIVLVGAEKVEKAFWGAQLLKMEVMRPLLVEGLMQCGASILPEVREERNFRRYAETRLAAEFSASRKFVAHPYLAGSEMRRQTGGGRPVLAIGPEGGWTDCEVEMLESLGFERMSLGSRILRTDTATIALVARLMPPG